MWPCSNTHHFPRLTLPHNANNVITNGADSHLLFKCGFEHIFEFLNNYGNIKHHLHIQNAWLHVMKTNMKMAIFIINMLSLVTEQSLKLLSPFSHIIVQKGRYWCNWQIGPAVNETQCFAPDYYEMVSHPGCYGFRNTNLNHSEEAKALFVTLGLLSEDGKPCTTSQSEMWKIHLPCTSRWKVQPKQPTVERWK
jgi:hypothetical protein